MTDPQASDSIFAPGAPLAHEREGPNPDDVGSLDAAMVDNPADHKRRHVLGLATAGVAGAGLLAVAVPFIETFQPSEAAKAAGAPVKVDLGSIAPGQLRTVEFRGKPVWIVHRTPEMLALLAKDVNLLADPRSQRPQQPAYAATPTRAIKPPFLVVTGICTHLGCVPTYRPEPAAADLGPDWPGGFYCPCHGSRFDLAGRVFKNVPAPMNLEIPAHSYLDDSTVLVGADAKTG